MNRYRMSHLSACVVWLSSGLCHALAQQPPNELLQNPSYESWKDGQPVAWEIATGKPSEEKRDIRTGSSAVRLVATKQGKYTSARLYHQAHLPLRPQTQYVMSFWARGKGRISFTCSDVNKKGYIGSFGSHNAELTGTWRKHEFAYGVSDDASVRVKLGVSLSGQGAFAILDDASFLSVGQAESEPGNLVENGNCNVDENGDGRPDHWTLSPMGSKAAASGQGPDGTLAALFKYAPSDTKGKPAFDPKTWWQWQSQQGGAPTWVAALSSSMIAIKPGRTYRISYQLRGDRVRLYHTKLFWMRDEKRLLRWRTIGPKREGRWNWERESLTLTAPPADVSAMRIAFWCLAGSGRVWVDNLTVQELSCRPISAHTDVADVKPVPGLLPLPPLPPKPDVRYSRRGAGPASIASSGESRVRVTKDGVTVHLKTGVVLTMPRTGDELLGVTDVRFGELPFRNPSAPPIAPVFDGLEAQGCHFLSTEVLSGSECVIHSLLKRSSGDAKLDWIFKPAERDVAGRRYVGFSYQYTLEATGVKIDQAMDRSTWELGGSPIGNTVIGQNPYAIENVFRLTADDTYCTAGGGRFAHGDGLEYQMGEAGALASFYTDPIPFVRCNRFGTADWIVYRDTPQFAGATRLTTPLKSVLFCAQAGHDEWTYLRDQVYAHHAAFYGIKPATPLPIANAWLSWWETPKKDGALYYEKLLYHFADKVVPDVAAMGFRIFAVHGIWSHGGCSPDRLEVGKEFGGANALRYLCDAARKHGMTVQAWSTTAHLWEHSPLFKENPSWRIRGPDGKPPTTYCYPTIRGAAFAEGFADYAVDQYRKVREQTGLDCLWLDSYCNFTHTIRCADRRAHLRQAEELFKYHGRLSQLGYCIYTESCGTFGVPAPGLPIGNLGTASPVLPEPYTRYNTSCYMGAAGTPRKEGTAIERVKVICAGDYYYRVLANKGSLMIYWKRFSEMKDLHAKIASANRDYNAVVDDMVMRQTLPNGLGVEWSGGDEGHVLFSFAEQTVRRAGLSRVIDVTTGKEVAVDGLGFTALPCHTYRLFLDHRR